MNDLVSYNSSSQTNLEPQRLINPPQQQQFLSIPVSMDSQHNTQLSEPAMESNLSLTSSENVDNVPSSASSIPIYNNVTEDKDVNFESMNDRERADAIRCIIREPSFLSVLKTVETLLSERILAEKS